MSKNSPILSKSIFLILIISLFFSAHNIKIYAETKALDIVATVAPENPKPYEDVTITLESYATDLNRAQIEWRSGEKILLKNTGVKDFSFKMGALGTKSLLDIKITTVEGDIIQKRIILSPGDMDILWQSLDSYVPPFYRGKALPPKEGRVKIIAIPSGPKGIQANSATYNWKLNDKTDQSQSGYKKNSFIFNLTNELEDTVEVVSMSSTDNTNSTGIIKISGVNPQILFYKKDPVEGIYYNKILDKEIPLESEEMTIKAEPYFMGDTTNTQAHIYEWKINGDTIPTPRKKNMLTIKPTARGGYAEINLYIENTLKLFQSATQSLKINL
ncbi:MAG: hypothetical protein KBD48_03175 [Candidatus Pacebacteria bacterium]|nr:hypothetical protein [Candidatus Paceibacterota bacterium]MBP9716162.1 hypothetical protein [Candidatus Paceibacterota bacterium]